MFIDKVKLYETPQQQQELADNMRLQYELLESIVSLRRQATQAEKAGDTEKADSLKQSGMEKMEALGLAQREEGRIRREVEQAYIDHFNGDVEAILADVYEIVNATSKEEYISWQISRTNSLQPTLERLSEAQDKESKREYKAVKQMATRGYTNCYYFILARIRVQLNALAQYGSEEGEKRAAEIVEGKTGQFYSKPKGAKASKRPTVEIIQQYEPASYEYGELLPMGHGQAIDLMRTVFGGDVDELPNRRKRFNRSTTITVEAQNEQRTIVSKSKNAEITLTVGDVTKLIKGNPMAKKILTKIFMNANEGSTVVQFSLRELVGEGMYSSLDSARNGFYKAGDILTSLKLSGKTTKGKIVQQGQHSVLFPNVKVDKAVCEVALNQEIPWDLIAPYHTAIPAYYFNLDNRAADLLYLIFTTARQRTKDIAEKGFFTISYRNIQYQLNLPNETNTKNPKRDIKDEIERAIEQIEEKEREYAKDHSRQLKPGETPDFSLYPDADPDAPIKKYLDEGKLVVSLKGKYASTFHEIEKHTVERIDRNQKRQQKIEDEAKIRARANQLAEAEGKK